MAELTFIVPGPPIGKARARVVVRGPYAHAYTPAKTRNFEALVRMAAAAAMNGQPPLAGALRLTATFIFTPALSWSKKKVAAALAGEWHHACRPDADNLLKAVTDGLSGVAFGDDAQLCHVSCTKIFGIIAETKIHVEQV